MSIDATHDSTYAKLRAQRKVLEANQSVDLEIPGWSGLLWARYKTIPYETFRDVSQRESGVLTATEELAAAWDTLIGACDCFLVRGDDDELAPLGDGTVRYDRRLAQFTGDDVNETPREIIDALFPSEPAVVGHRDQYLYWLATGKSAVETELGKDSAQTAESD